MNIAFEGTPGSGQWASVAATSLEKKLFLDAASKEEFVNQETLTYQFLKIVCQKVEKIHPQQTGNYPTSTSLSIHTRMPGLSDSCSSDMLDPHFNQFIGTGAKFNTLVANNMNQLYSLKGSPCKCKLGVAASSDEMNISACLGIREEKSFGGPSDWQNLNHGKLMDARNENISFMTSPSAFGENPELSDSKSRIPLDALQPDFSCTEMFTASSTLEIVQQSQSHNGELHQTLDNVKRSVCLNSRKDNCGGLSFGGLEEILRPWKRLKMENPSCHVSSESENSYVLDSSSLEKWPESSISVNSEVTPVAMDMLTNLMKECSAIRKVINNVPVDIPRLSTDFVPSASAKLNDATFVAEKLISSCEDEVFRAKVDLAKLGTENNVIAAETNCERERERISSDCEEEMVRPKVDLTKSEIENNVIVVKANCETKRELCNQISGVSLIEFFTAAQIMEHISSLRQWIKPRILEEEKGNKRIYYFGENSCQLCGADKLSLHPTPIYCSFCDSRVKRMRIYFSTAEENGMRHCFCTKCYKESRGGTITLHDGIIVSKDELHKKKNDDEHEESWVQCNKCEGWQHKICALYNNKRDMEGKVEFICPLCCLEEIQNGDSLRSTNSVALSAKDLPSTMLSNSIEQRLFRCLQQERKETAKALGKSIDEVPGAEDLTVRVVLSVDRHVTVKKPFLDVFQDYPADFPYRSKVILLFQKIEGADVCLFAMYVQEFGSECSHPNQRCVYVSYIDSVKYFRPNRRTATGESLRTFVYHEILIGYLEYCKKRGFATCYLWACPPQKGEDFILYCHPENQKTPKPDKLLHWYQLMLSKATKEKIVLSCTNLYDDFFVLTGQYNSKVTAAHLPHFDGDYWSGIAEDFLKNIEGESEKASRKKVKELMSKRTMKSMGHEDPPGGALKDILLMQKLGQTILPLKENFMIVHLHFGCTYCHKAILSGWRWFCSQCKNFHLCERCHDVEKKLSGDDTHTSSNRQKHALSKVMVDDVPLNTLDDDIILENAEFEYRHALLSFCQENNYQFDTLRRAKHSSMMILHHLCGPIMLPSGIPR